MLKWWKRFIAKEKEQRIMAKCGHETLSVGEIDVFGHKVQLKLSDDSFAPEFCLECFAKMIILCGWCREPIFPGRPVTLYTATDPNYKLPTGAHWYDQARRIVIGCLRWKCADTGADRAGFWVAPGRVQPVLSPLAEAMMTGTMVIAENLSDLKKAKRPEEN